ncbi:hypothetical protein [Helicobacter sp. 23-1045]
MVLHSFPTSKNYKNLPILQILQNSQNLAKNLQNLAKNLQNLAKNLQNLAKKSQNLQRFAESPSKVKDYNKNDDFLGWILRFAESKCGFL